MCGCRRKAGPGNKRNAYSPSPIPTRIIANPNNLQLQQVKSLNNLPVNNSPIALNQNVNIGALNTTRTNILRRSVYEQARLKAFKK